MLQWSICRGDAQLVLWCYKMEHLQGRCSTSALVLQNGVSAGEMLETFTWCKMGHMQVICQCSAIVLMSTQLPWCLVLRPYLALCAGMAVVVCSQTSVKAIKESDTSLT